SCSVALAVALAAGTALPTVAGADGLTTNIAVSNMYLWRGQNLSPNGGVVSGGLNYGLGGLYTGMWTSSETGGHETDLYLGFGGEAGGLSYDISYWHYLYPEDGKIADSDLSEAVLSLGYGPVKLTAYQSVDDKIGAGATGDDWLYATLAVSVDKYTLTYGAWTGFEKANQNASNYSHVTASFAATEEVSVSVSVAQAESGKNIVDEDPLFQVSYSKQFDVK
ncbi:MAG: TorF family putative porin, partial [Gammaproteobacteria bacterium]|nr:TorF family putative porin [Gammaproteobacteria bacterium]